MLIQQPMCMTMSACRVLEKVITHTCHSLHESLIHFSSVECDFSKMVILLSQLNQIIEKCGSVSFKNYFKSRNNRAITHLHATNENHGTTDSPVIIFLIRKLSVIVAVAVTGPSMTGSNEVLKLLSVRVNVLVKTIGGVGSIVSVIGKSGTGDGDVSASNSGPSVGLTVLSIVVVSVIVSNKGSPSTNPLVTSLMTV